LKQNTSCTNFLNGKVEFIPSRVVDRQSRTKWREVVMAEAVDHGGSTTKCDDQCRNRGGSRSLKQRRKKRKKESLPWLGCASDLAMT